MKVIIAAGLGHGLTVSSPIRYAFAATQGGKVTFAHNGTAAPGSEGEHLVTAAQLAPGQYRLRAAAIDGTTAVVAWSCRSPSASRWRATCN